MAVGRRGFVGALVAIGGWFCPPWDRRPPWVILHTVGSWVAMGPWAWVAVGSWVLLVVGRVCVVGWCWCWWVVAAVGGCGVSVVGCHCYYWL